MIKSSFAPFVVPDTRAARGIIAPDATRLDERLPPERATTSLATVGGRFVSEQCQIQLDSLERLNGWARTFASAAPVSRMAQRPCSSRSTASV